MPIVTISPSTMELVRTNRLPGFRFGWAATRLDSGWWNVPIDDEAAVLIASRRVRGESDDGVVARLGTPLPL